MKVFMVIFLYDGGNVDGWVTNLFLTIRFYVF